MKKIFFTLIGLCGLAACSNSFLDSSPMTQTTNENYYKTPQDA